MTTAIIETRGLLVASRADRLVRALLLPFGEVGRTNLGRFSVEHGVFTLPADPDVVTFNDEHERSAPIGRAVELEETDDGILATFRIANTPEGDAALDDIDTGRRRSVSAEVAGVVIRAGKAVAGRLFGAALVAAGAFPSATLLAADVGEDTPEAETEATTEEEEETMPETPAEAPAPAETESTTTPSEAPATLTAGQRGGASQPREERLTINEPSDMFAALAHYHQSGNRAVLEALADPRNAGDSDLFAALTSVKTGTPNYANRATQPEWLGKFWSGEPYRRRVVEHFAGKALTSLTVRGFKWTTKPTMDTWAANGAAVPSNSPVVGPQTDQTAQAFAGAHSIPRELRDFPNPEFWEGYFEGMRESYAIGTEVYGSNLLLTSATAVEHGTVPTDVAPALVKVIDGALAVNKKGGPTLAVLSESDWREFVLTPHDNVLAYLSSAAGLTEGQAAGFQLLPTPFDAAGDAVVPDGDVLVGTKAAATFRELPGVPLRVEGLDVSTGQVQPGLFGYALMQIDEPLGLALVSAPAAP
jgi:hypothetical protein